MDEKKYSELSRYFTLKEWNKMSEYDRTRCYNILENYKVLHSLDLTTKRPDFMCVTKRQSKEEECHPKRKDVKSAVKMNSKYEIVPSKEENAWLFNPSPGVLAQDIQEDFLGFPEADYVGETVGLSTLNEAIKELESEIQNLVEAENGSSKKAKSPRRYPKRAVARKDYTEGNVPNDDDYIFCDDCNQEWEGDCPFHGPLTVVEDTKVPPDPTDPTRADRTVPPQLCIAESGISGADNGVWTRVPLPKGLRFGPYEGVKVKSSNSNGYCWQVRQNSRPLYCIDAKNCGVANWMRYVNCARHQEEQNLMAFQYKGEMYYRTIKHIPAHVEVLVWYGDDYGRDLGIDVENFHKPQQKQSHNVFCCAGCCITYSSPLYLAQHAKYCRGLKGTRLSNNSAVCSVKCGTSNSNDNSLICGNRLCHNNGHDNSFSGNSDHVEHTGTSDGNDTCDMRCFQKSDLSEHIRDKMYQGHLHGPKCTAGPSVLKQQTSNTGEKPHVCKECGHRFTRKCNLIRHLKIHRGEKPFVCEECGYKSTRKCDLIQHLNIHTGEKPYICKECGHRFTHKCSLIRHLKIHRGEKPFVCEECGYKSTYKCDLIQHLKIHRGEKPYICKECGHRFTQKCSLIRHLKIHTGEKPHVCKECGYKSTYKCDLIKHLNIHTGEKPYICKECGHRFTQMPGLIWHLKIHHKSNHVSCSATHTKAKRNRNTNTQSEFSKLNVTQSQKALNLSNEE